LNPTLPQIQNWPEARRDFAPRPTLLAWCLSAAVHAAILTWFGAAAPLAPRLAAFDTLEVALAAADPGNVRPTPQPRAEPLPATLPAALAPTVDHDRDPGDERDDSPLVEARYDVAAFHNPKPPYPLAARRLGLEGRVLLTAHVRADGRCGNVRLRASSGHELLDDAALDTVRRWRFLPARRGDAAVDSWVEIPISFRLAG
jgi:protein TonB